MTASSKNLTVSFGAFRCSVEGFDDSVETVARLAAYFRDLTTADGHFGADPTPRAGALAPLAAPGAGAPPEQALGLAAGPDAAPPPGAEASITERFERLRAAAAGAGIALRPDPSLRDTFWGAAPDPMPASPFDESPPEGPDDPDDPAPGGGPAGGPRPDAPSGPTPPPQPQAPTQPPQTQAPQPQGMAPGAQPDPRAEGASARPPSAGEPDLAGPSEATPAHRSGTPSEVLPLPPGLGSLPLPDKAAPDSPAKAAPAGPAPAADTAPKPGRLAAVDLGRLMSQVQERMSQADLQRRRDTLSHLRAVVQTRAPEALPAPVEADADVFAFRDDLDLSLGRPRQPADTAPGRLTLSPTQRVDHSVRAPDQLGRGGFAEFAAAHDLPDERSRVEAAAAYLSLGSDRARFTRLDLLTVLTETPGLGLSRDEVARGFANLLREGRIVKQRGGYFGVYAESPFLPDQRETARGA